MMTSTLDRMRDALRSIPSDDRDTWIRMAMAVKAELGDAGFEVFDEWSQQGEKYDPQDSRNVWKSVREVGKVTAGSLFHEARNHGWSGDGEFRRQTPEEFAERQRITAELSEREAEEIAREQQLAAKNAMLIWQAAGPVTADHPYLLRKKVSPVASLRVIDAVVSSAILGYTPKSRGEVLTGQLLVVPIKVGDALSTCELISAAGCKTALFGRGTKAGGFWAAQPLPAGGGDGVTLLVGEGVATVLSAKGGSEYLGVAALSSGNLMAVATAMRKRFPSAVIVVLADLVKTTGDADPHAVEAASSVGGKLAVPHFGDCRPDGATDFNDMANLCGEASVRRAIDQAVITAEPDERSNRFVAKGGKIAHDWPEPQPLTGKVQAEPYPLDALPIMVRAAVAEVAGFVKAPLPLVASSALAALSLAIQAQADVKRADKLTGPSGLFLLTVADSGERKSTCDGFFTGAIRAYEDAQVEAAKPLMQDYRADSEAWDAKRGGVKERIRQLAKDNKPTGEVEESLRALEGLRPEPPRSPRLLYADATPEALAFSLAKQWPSGGVVSAEAGVVFGSHGMSKDSVMRNLAQLNQLWDGNSLTIDRRSSDSFTVRGARLTVALQIQAATLRSFFDRSGGLARGTGFLARFLVAWPESTQGYRPFSEAPASWPCLETFERRLTDILELPTSIDEDGTLKPQMLSLTDRAKDAWISFYNAIEAELRSGGELYEVRDVASKSADNAARLAALFQVFEHGGGDIDLDVFEGASRIAAWHLNEARRFFGELALPEELVDAARLGQWLRDYCRRDHVQLVPVAKLQRGGPSGLRTKASIDAAMRELEGLGHARWIQDGRQRLIAVNPALLVEEA